MHGTPLLAGCSLLLVVAGVVAGATVLLLLAWLGRQRAPTTTEVTVPIPRPAPARLPPPADRRARVEDVTANAPAGASGASPAPHLPPSPVAGTIVWTGGPLAGMVNDVPPAGLWIGREPPAQVVIAEAEVSRLHCWVGPRDGAMIVVDDHSSNGTLVMGEPIGRRPLRDGDVVVLARGAASFRYERSIGG